MRQASPSSPIPSPQSSTRYKNGTFRQINRSKSFTAINKLLSGQSAFAKPPSPPRLQPQTSSSSQHSSQRPKSTSFQQQEIVTTPSLSSPLITGDSKSLKGISVPTHSQLHSGLPHPNPMSTDASTFRLEKITPYSGPLNHQANVKNLNNSPSPSTDFLSRKAPVAPSKGKCTKVYEVINE